MMLLVAVGLYLSTIFIKGMQIDTKRQEPGAVAERAGGHLHAQVQRQTLVLSPPLFQRSLSPPPITEAPPGPILCPLCQYRGYPHHKPPAHFVISVCSCPQNVLQSRLKI